MLCNCFSYIVYGILCHCVRRCLWPDRRGAYREHSGEVSVRSRRVRPDAVSQSADALRKTTLASSVTSDSIGPRHRAVVLRSSRRKDPDRNPHQGHVAQRGILQLALHADPVTPSSYTLCILQRPRHTRRRADAPSYLAVFMELLS